MEGKIVCYCSNVTQKQIVEAIHNGAKSLQDIQQITGACLLNKCEELSPKKR